MTTVNKMVDTAQELINTLKTHGPDLDGICYLVGDLQAQINAYSAEKAILEKTQDWHEHGMIAPSCVGCPTAEAVIRDDMVMVLLRACTLAYSKELVTQLQKYRDAKKELQRFERTETFQKCPTSHEWMKRKMDIDCAMIIMMDILSQIERETVEGGESDLS